MSADEELFAKIMAQVPDEVARKYAEEPSLIPEIVKIPEGGYHDIDGNPCSLDKLCRTEPQWAASRIELMVGLLQEALGVMGNIWDEECTEVKARLEKAVGNLPGSVGPPESDTLDWLRNEIGAALTQEIDEALEGLVRERDDHHANRAAGSKPRCGAYIKGLKGENERLRRLLNLQEGQACPRWAALIADAENLIRCSTGRKCDDHPCRRCRIANDLGLLAMGELGAR